MVQALTLLLLLVVPPMTITDPRHAHRQSCESSVGWGGRGGNWERYIYRERDAFVENSALTPTSFGLIQLKLCSSAQEMRQEA